MRGLWIAIALLHAGLIVRRLALGEWTGWGGAVRGALCLTAVLYAWLKLRRVALFFDSHPRRAWTFGLLLLVGHVWAVPPSGAYPALDLTGRGPAAVALTLAILPAAVGVALVAVGRAHWLKARNSRKISFSYYPHCCVWLAVALGLGLELWLTPALGRRPPPVAA